MPSDETDSGKASESATDLPTWLTYDDLVAIHEVTMSQMGEPPRPVIDESRLRSKLMRPENAYHYEGVRDPFLLGAITAVAISQARAFEDGNKRTALGVLTVLLGLAGYDFAVEDESVGRWLIAIAETSDRNRDAKVEEFADWLREATVSR